MFIRACLHGDGGPQIGEETCGGYPTSVGYLTYLGCLTSVHVNRPLELPALCEALDEQGG